MTDVVKVLKWDRNDTPIPKKGETLVNMFNDHYMVTDVKKGNPDYTITMEMIRVK